MPRPASAKLARGIQQLRHDAAQHEPEPGHHHGDRLEEARDAGLEALGLGQLLHRAHDRDPLDAVAGAADPQRRAQAKSKVPAAAMPRYARPSASVLEEEEPPSSAPRLAHDEYEAAHRPCRSPRRTAARRSRRCRRRSPILRVDDLDRQHEGEEHERQRLGRHQAAQHRLAAHVGEALPQPRPASARGCAFTWGSDRGRASDAATTHERRGVEQQRRSAMPSAATTTPGEQRPDARPAPVKPTLMMRVALAQQARAASAPPPPRRA